MFQKSVDSILRSLLLLNHVIQIFLIWVAFQSSDRVEFWGFSVIKIALKLKSQRNEKVELSSQGSGNFQVLGNETLIIADYKKSNMQKSSRLLC